MNTTTPLERWVEEASQLTKPKSIHWCDGSEKDFDALISTMVEDGTLYPLNAKSYPNCYLHRSNPNDVARTENLTFICTQHKEDAGPTNNWMNPSEAKAKVGKLFQGSMSGRTMYVIPYVMGPAGSPYSKVGVEVTDSPYVAASMYLMTRVGKVATDELGMSDDFVPGLHSLGDLSPDRRFIMHFPEEKLIWSVGSGYGGNALLGKKCFALRIASWMARQEGWMAEHMLVLGLEEPGGKITYIAAAFPSASGKTNLAMMVSTLADQGYKVWTVGDDIAWLHIDSKGQLRAINPEAGFFGVAPGTSSATNPVAMETIRQNALFTNVALTSTNEPWWEGIGAQAPNGLTDWKGRSWKPEFGTAAHPNSRFTVPAKQCPIISSHWEDPEGVPISAIIFGSRRSDTVPLVREAYNWDHGVLMGAGIGAETTAAATGTVGVVRRDPMAMLPFCGYNMGDYFSHWFSMGERMKNPPKIFRVNWFRKRDGKFLWPGFGENIRILKWIVERVQGKGTAIETPLGYMPTYDGLDLEGLDISKEAFAELTAVDRDLWTKNAEEVGTFFSQFGDRMPKKMWTQLDLLKSELKKRPTH